jgi:hypothetical protein
LTRTIEGQPRGRAGGGAISPRLQHRLPPITKVVHFMLVTRQTGKQREWPLWGRTRRFDRGPGNARYRRNLVARMHPGEGPESTEAV